jgi:chromosome segregation ATPase
MIPRALHAAGEEPAILRTLERGSLLIVLLALVGLGFWLGSRDHRLDRKIEEQGKTLERNDQRLLVEETATVEHAAAIERNRAAIEEHRVAIAELHTKQALREAELAALTATSRTLEDRLGKAETDLARHEELATELATVRERLSAIEAARTAEQKRLSTLEKALRELEAEREGTRERLDRLERALGIDP